MKIKQIIAFSLTALITAFSLNSCGPEEKLNPAPGIDLIAESGSIVGDVTMDGDKAFTIVFNVSDNSKVKTVEVTSVVNGRISPQFDSTINSANAKIKLSRKSYAAIATEVWTIKATDDGGETTTKSFTVTTTSAASGDALKPFLLDNSNQTFKVYNINSPNGFAGAFDLMDGTPRFSGDPASEKDIHDSCTTTEIINWPGRWTSKNGTIFKKVTGYTFDDITNTGQLEAAWTASGATKKWMVVAKDELYIAKVRGSNDKVLVLITAVVKLPAQGDNKDYVSFQFKRKI
ncbi:MAG: hypothetical protein ACKVQB_09425 [Bacteroidia bacterium]